MTPADRAEIAAQCLRRLAHDLDMAGAEPSPQAAAIVAESRREAANALRDLRDALPVRGTAPLPWDTADAQLEALANAAPIGMTRWAEAWDAWALAQGAT